MGLFKDIGTLFKATVNIAGYIDTEAAEKAIRGNIYFRGPNAWILAIATIIASIGLNVNSIPVVIGAMLISPLMGPIFGLGLGLGVNDMTLLKSSGKNLLVMVCISLAASFLYFLITPLSLSNPTELLARTNPTIYDVLIALFGGFAGILEQCRKEKGTVFSGVAIATALMPPLCTAGFGLASGNLGYFLGALYLFFINCLFIMLATYISVKYFRFRQTEYEDQATGRKTKRISSILIILFIVPSIWSAVTLIRQNNFEENAAAFIEQSKTYSRSIIYDYRIDHTDGSVIELFFTGDPLDEKTKETIRKAAEEYGIKESQLIINDHTYNNDTNDIELVKGIYDKMDEEIAKRDEEIRRLKEELRASKGADIPYSQIVREMKSNYPSIEEVHITHGAGVTADSLQVNESMIVLVTSSARLSEEDSTRLIDWLKIRLDSDSAKLILTN
ncbi:MAG: TIGR00341 family protein [Bacteroidales bacterium]|nr:TIGR00341 family protein [Bacteroidales bacterium]